VQLSNGDVRNSYTIKLRNMESRPRTMEIGMVGLPNGRIWRGETQASTATRAIRLTVAPDSVEKVTVFAIAPYAGPQTVEFSFTVRALDAQGGGDSHVISFERPVEQ
jgi:hypothetical protein